MCAPVLPELFIPRFCTRCGTPIINRLTQVAPFLCEEGHETWISPRPVASAVLRVGDCVVLVRRGIEPQKGKWCLPGGFVNPGESAQAAAGRELWEETGIALLMERFHYITDYPVPVGNVLLNFFRARWNRKRDGKLPAFIPSTESPEIALFPADRLPVDMAFESHIWAIMLAFGLLFD